MPIPIMPVNTGPLERRERDSRMQAVEYCQIDVSNLPVSIQKRSKLQDMLKVSNVEANLLFQLWSESGAGPNDKNVGIPRSMSNGDVLRLKVSGLIAGDTEHFTLTQRGKDVISTLALGEKNAFDKNSNTQSYEKMVSDRERNSTTGPRFAVGKGSVSK